MLDSKSRLFVFPLLAVFSVGLVQSLNAISRRQILLFSQNPSSVVLGVAAAHLATSLFDQQMPCQPVSLLLYPR